MDRALSVGFSPSSDHGAFPTGHHLTLKGDQPSHTKLREARLKCGHSDMRVIPEPSTHAMQQYSIVFVLFLSTARELARNILP